MKNLIVSFASIIIMVSCSKQETFVTETAPTNNLITSVNPWTKYCGWHYNNGSVPN